MTKKRNLPLIVFSAIFYALAIGLMIYGTANDLQINMAVFNPQSSYAIGFEAFGLVVSWGMWGPMFTVLFLTAHDLNGCLDVLRKIFPFIKPINTENKKLAILNKAVKIFFQILFFVLCVIGWKKIIENVFKKFFDISQPIYFIVCAIVSVLAILLFSRIKKENLAKLETLALAGLLLGLLYKEIESLKTITQRVRFREMVAASNNIFNDKGLSAGKLSGIHTPLTKDMAQNSDFSAFTNWYCMGKGSCDIYSHTDSFPSGHTFSSCAVFLSALFCSAFEKLKKYTNVLYIVSGVYVAAMAFSRLVAGAHYLTDVASGAIIGYSLFLFVLFVYNFFTKRGILPTNS